MNTLELNVTELSFNELKTIDGGIAAPPWWNPFTAAVIAATVIIGAAYQAGEAVGEALYYATH